MTKNNMHLNRSREVALQLLFQKEFSSAIDTQMSLDVFKENFPAPDEVWSYSQKIVETISENSEEIDKTIQAHAQHWKLDRMAMVDLNIMRIAVYEMVHLKDSPSAAINEALELSKKYGTTESSAFVNGVLDSIAKEL